MPGFRVVESIHQRVKLPVITTCADEDKQLLHQSLSCGACFHIVKPINIKNLEFVWNKSWITKARGPILPGPRLMTSKQPNLLVTSCSSSSSQSFIHMKHSEQASPSSSVMLTKDKSSPIVIVNVDEQDNNSDNGEMQLKKRSQLWDYDLHRRFMVAVCLLGKDAVPSNIIGIMNVAGLTTKQVSSHLQKHRQRVNQQEDIQRKSTAAAANSTTNSAMGKRPIDVVLEKQTKESMDSTTKSYSEKSISRSAPYILHRLSNENTQTGILGVGKNVRGRLLHNGKIRQPDGNCSRTSICLPKQQSTAKQVPNVSNLLVEMFKKQRSQQGEVGAITANQLQTSHSGSVGRNTSNTGTFPNFTSTHGAINPFASIRISQANSHSGSSANHDYIIPSIRNVVGSATEINTLLSNVDLTVAVSPTMQVPSFVGIEEWPGVDEFVGLDELHVTQNDKTSAGDLCFDDLGLLENYDDTIPSIMDDVGSATRINSLLSNVDSTVEVRPTIQVPPSVVVEEYPGLDEFVGLNGSHVTEKNDTASVGNLSSDEYGIDINNITFDDALLTEMLDDIDKNGEVWR